MKRKMSYSLLWLMLGAIVIQTGSQRAQAQFGPHTPNSNWHAVGNTMVGVGAAWGAASPFCGPGVTGCAIGAGIMAGGGMLLNFLAPSDAPNGGFPPNQPLLNNIQDGGSGPGFCDLACQAERMAPGQGGGAFTGTGGYTAGSGCSVWWGCVAAMESGKLTVSTSGAKPSYLVKLPPTHPVRSTLGNLVPRPDWRGFVAYEWMAPHYRTVLTRLR